MLTAADVISVSTSFRVGYHRPGSACSGVHGQTPPTLGTDCTRGGGRLTAVCRLLSQSRSGPVSAPGCLGGRSAGLGGGGRRFGCSRGSRTLRTDAGSSGTPTLPETRPLSRLRPPSRPSRHDLLTHRAPPTPEKPHQLHTPPGSVELDLTPTLCQPSHTTSSSGVTYAAFTSL